MMEICAVKHDAVIAILAKVERYWHRPTDMENDYLIFAFSYLLTS